MKRKPARGLICQLGLVAGHFFIGTSIAFGQSISVNIHRISESGIGEKIGNVVLEAGKRGLIMRVAVRGLLSGSRGFHLHENGDCRPGIDEGKMAAGMAAGNHFDPETTKSHNGPGGRGHKGDLPVLRGTDKGINQSVVAQRLKLSDARGRALVIHEAGDNYKDVPENGGSKGRIACGVVPAE